MAKFSVGREEDDSEGPSRRRPKRRRTTRCYQSQRQRQENPTPDQQEEEVEVVSECDEQGEEQDEEERESERAEELEEEEGCEEEESSGANLGRQSVGDRGDGSISVTLTDPDVLDCPICLEPLNSHVFQCENGHIACSSCCIKVGNKCPSCSWPIGYNRCRAIEKVIESVKISCINIKYGCNESVTYNKKHDHEEMCIYVPCSCPLSGCNFIGSSKDLFQHFTVNHLNSAKRFDYNRLLPLELGLGQRYLILQEQTDRTTFVLNHGVELLGSVVNVICIAPSSTKIRYAYDLIARNEDTSVRLQSFTECIPQWDKHLPLNMFLLVPSNFHGVSGKLKLELCIRRPSDVHAPVVRGNCVV